MAINAIRIQLVDDHEIVRSGFRQLLESAPDIEVVAESGSGEDAYRDYSRHDPDVVIMDINMPGQDGMVAARHILQSDPGARILMLTMHDSAVYASRLLKMGVKGYITKRSAPEELIRAVRLTARGRPCIDPDVAQEMAMQSLSGGGDPFDVLSPREFEVFCLLADGHSVNEISRILRLGPKTVGTHRVSIQHKLNVENLADMARVAIRYGVMEA